MSTDQPITDKKGEDNPSAKLTEADVREIRRRLAIGKKNRVDAIARDFEVTPQTIWGISTRKSWGHVE